MIGHEIPHPYIFCIHGADAYLGMVFIVIELVCDVECPVLCRGALVEPRDQLQVFHAAVPHTGRRINDPDGRHPVFHVQRIGCRLLQRHGPGCRIRRPDSPFLYNIPVGTFKTA